MKPRVFISHGAGEDDAVWTFVEAIASRLEGDFQVFLDRDRIHSGQGWRGELDRELTTCHCGVAVTSDRSLDRPEVRREVDFLLLRAGQSPAFVVVPVLAGVDLPTVEQKGARGLDALDIVDQPDPALAADEVADGLAPVLAAHLDDRELRWKTPLRARLQRAQRAALEDAAQCLGRSLEEWPWVVDPAGAVAQWMLQCRDVAALFAATEALHTADPTVDAAAVFDTALPHAWIDWNAASCVRQAIEASTSVAVDSLRTETGEMYVRRTVWGPKVEQLTNVAGEEDVELLAEAELALRRILFAGATDVTKEELMAELALAKPRPVLVLPFEPPGREAVCDVLSEFPGVALVFCAGPRTVWIREEGDVARTEPGLDCEHEKFVLLKLKGARRFARSGGGS